jgi:hypothetical protein
MVPSAFASYKVTFVSCLMVSLESAPVHHDPLRVSPFNKLRPIEALRSPVWVTKVSYNAVSDRAAYEARGRGISTKCGAFPLMCAKGGRPMRSSRCFPGKPSTKSCALMPDELKKVETGSP